MRVKVGSVALAAASGCGIGLDDNGQGVEFTSDWVDLDALDYTVGGPKPVYLDVEDWAVIAIDDQPRIPLTREGMAERVRFPKGSSGAAGLSCGRWHRGRPDLRIDSTRWQHHAEATVAATTAETSSIGHLIVTRSPGVYRWGSSAATTPER